MAVPSRRIFATHVAEISKEARVPLAYAYGWLTDFREDDGQFAASRPRFRVTKLGADRIVRVRTSNPKAPHKAVAVELVRLTPPDRWHVDQIDESDLESVDYQLEKVGPRTTRIRLLIVERWTVRNHPAKAVWVRQASEFWDRLVRNLELRYRSGRSARG